MLGRTCAKPSLSTAFARTLLAAALVLCFGGVAGAQAVDWTLTKTANPTTYTAAGQIITYTYQITNTRGDGTLNSLTDDKVADISCPTDSVPEGTTLTCTGTYTIQAGDLGPGASVTNHATAKGDACNDGCDRSADASATVTFSAQPLWALKKTASPTTYTASGQTISYSYVVTNTGNVSISAISVSDDKAGAATCPATTLAVGADMTCTANYATTAADVTAGSVTNTATAHGTPAAGDLGDATAQATVTFSANPLWTLKKTASPTTYSAAGQTISYSYVVTNTGNVSISAISVSDDKAGAATCPATTLAVGADMTCTASYATTAADVTAGSVTNTATAHGTPAAGDLGDATAQATVTFSANPLWTLKKTASPTTYSAAGQTISYSYVVTNTGNVSISAISVSDDKAGAAACPATTLAVGADMTCTASYATTAVDVTAGSVTNTATAHGTPASGTLADVTAQATVTLSAQPSWTLGKTASPTTYTAAGQTISYSYVVTNTGNVSISAISVSDDKAGAAACPATTLAVGADMTCTASYATTAADVTAGSVTNHATAHGTPASGTLADVTAQATVTYRASNGSITIIVQAIGTDATFGFTSTISGAASFSLATTSGTASRSFSDLPASVYDVTETSLGSNWTLTSLTCSGDAGGTATTTNVADRAVSIGLDSGESITCVFVNAFDGTGVSAMIADFLGDRVSLLASEEPDRARFLRRVPGSLWGDDGGAGPGGAGGEPFTLSATGTGPNGQMVFSTSLSQIEASRATLGGVPLKGANGTAAPPNPRFDLWIEAHYVNFGSSSGNVERNGNFGIVYLGADYLVGRSVLVGALVQFDSLRENLPTPGTWIGGEGVMAGPYISARLTPHLFFDARAAWGSSRNHVDPFGFYEDAFATDRWLAHAKLTGNWNWGDDFRITPGIAFDYVQESQHQYVDSLGETIAAQTVSLGRLTFGPEIARRIVRPDGTTIEPHVLLAGQWDFAHGLLSGSGPPDGGFHARVEAGVLVHTPSDLSFRVVGTYDGIGSGSYHAYGAQVWLNLPIE